jgi:hypothetical protein
VLCFFDFTRVFNRKWPAPPDECHKDYVAATQTMHKKYEDLVVEFACCPAGKRLVFDAFDDLEHALGYLISLLKVCSRL